MFLGCEGFAGAPRGGSNPRPAMHMTSSLCPARVLRHTKASMSHTLMMLSRPPLSRRPPREQRLSTLPLWPRSTLHMHSPPSGTLNISTCRMAEEG